ncbi:MAG: SpoIIE family protein phosphatase [Elainellaceae cyanobacterium]
MTGILHTDVAEMQRSNALMRQLLAFGTSLSAEQDFNRLIEKIVEAAKSLCCADAGILYLQKDLKPSDRLDCAIVQIDSLHLNLNLLQTPISEALFPQVELFLSAGSLPSLVVQAALTGNLIQVSELEHSLDWQSDQQFDQNYGYHSVSCLVVPLKSSDNTVLGVLKLINPIHSDTGKVIGFDATLCEIMQWFATRVSSVLNDYRLLQNQANWAKAEQELQIGHKIQLDFLPETLPEVKGWEISARFYPAKDVAGDFYDAFAMGHGRIGIVIADVCDKGVGAALFMSLFRSLLRILAQQNYSLGLLDVLTDMPTQTRKTAQDRQSRLPSIGTQALKNAIERSNNYIAGTHFRTNMFATIFFGVLDPSTGKLIYINGGHESPIICNAQGIKQRLTKTGPAVGIFPNADFRIEMTQLDPGDTLLGYTDGIPDACNPQRERYTEKRLCELVEATPMHSAKALLDQIDTCVHAYIADTAPFDDITLIAVRREE